MEVNANLWWFSAWVLEDCGRILHKGGLLKIRVHILRQNRTQADVEDPSCLGRALGKARKKILHCQFLTINTSLYIHIWSLYLIYPTAVVQKPSCSKFSFKCFHVGGSPRHLVEAITNPLRRNIL